MGAVKQYPLPVSFLSLVPVRDERPKQRWQVWKYAHTAFYSLVRICFKEERSRSRNVSATLFCKAENPAGHIRRPMQPDCYVMLCLHGTCLKVRNGHVRSLPFDMFSSMTVSSILCSAFSVRGWGILFFPFFAQSSVYFI